LFTASDSLKDGLTAAHITKRVKLSKQFIKKVNRGGIRFLDRIITTDESWFHYLCPWRNDLMYGNIAELTVWPRGTACVSSIPFLSIKRINIFFPSDLVIFAFFGGGELQFFH
jgi:hypothetical protein